MRSLISAIVLLGMAAPQAVAQVPERALKVVSCADADSLLGPLGNDRRATVRGAYFTDRDETFLTVGSVAQTMGLGHYFGGTVQYFGADPLSAGDTLGWGTATASVALFIRGRPGLAVQAAGSPPPAPSLFADDSALVARSPKIGEYRGPPEMAVVPLNYPLSYGSLVQLARADRVEVRLGDKRYEMSSHDRRHFRAMLRIALCSGARSP
jgi:hypothetical protein